MHTMPPVVIDAVSYHDMLNLHAHAPAQTHRAMQCVQTRSTLLYITPSHHNTMPPDTIIA